MREHDGSRRTVLSWALYDWANSAFPTVILTFVFSAYFTRAVAPDEITGSQVWGTVIGGGGLLIAILGPILGAASDQTGRRKPWILLFTLLCVASTAALWWITPDASLMWQAALLVGLATIGLELAIVLYNAMLPDLASRETIGRWSGWGWALGYAGGLLCLVTVLFLFIEEGTRIGSFDTESAEHLRAGHLLLAAGHLSRRLGDLEPGAVHRARHPPRTAPDKSCRTGGTGGGSPDSYGWPAGCWVSRHCSHRWCGWRSGSDGTLRIRNS